MINSPFLCSPEQLQEVLQSSTTRVLDCSWYLPSQRVDTQKAFAEQHIPGAAFFDIDQVCDQKSDLPHMLPTMEVFAAAVGQLGINNDMDIVVYDTAGIFSAARVWWMFHVFGHPQVRVLNGGLPAWLEFGGGLSNQVDEKIVSVEFLPSFNADMVALKTDLIQNCEAQSAVVLDARPSGRFLGHDPEPRPGLLSGHMPHSLSLPFSKLMYNGQMRSADELLAVFDELGVKADSTVITTCGSGVTAAIVTLALAEAGLGMHSLYDGAWAEWGAASDTIKLISK